MIEVIRSSEWQSYSDQHKHVFLVGNLEHAVPYPFFRRSDAELIWCEYQPGDHGLPHWHAETDEIEIVLDGSVGYRDITSNEVTWLKAGDVRSIRRGVCAERIVRERARTIALKLPSHSGKIHCRECHRKCGQRREPFCRV